MTKIGSKKYSEEENARLKRFVDKLVQIRTTKELSVADFAKQLNIDPSQLAYFENTGGAKTITLLKIFNYLQKKNYSLDWLIMDDNSNFRMKQSNEMSLMFDITDLEETLSIQVKKQDQFIKETKNALEKVKATLEKF